MGGAGMICRACGNDTPYPAASCEACGASLARRQPSRIGDRLGEYGCVYLMLGYLAALAGLALLLGTRMVGAATAVTTCHTNARQVTAGLLAYAADWDGTLPPADDWCHLVTPYLGTPRRLRCPRGQGRGRSDYWLNAEVSGVRLDSIADRQGAIVVVEGPRGWNGSGTPDQIPEPAEHRGYCGFADGHTAPRRQGKPPRSSPLTAPRGTAVDGSSSPHRS